MFHSQKTWHNLEPVKTVEATYYKNPYQIFKIQFKRKGMLEVIYKEVSLPMVFLNPNKHVPLLDPIQPYCQVAHEHLVNL